ncbi:unnamed protein product [Adineta ricciae]|uniref:glutathione gamma-glutamylcysteinyltransferase n=1 Tax=Adineta ricciae TaxID=249248 RepID=A0A815AR11_ADIRI|nr:unnamed protein product [Adineta ricciae]
MEKSWSRTDLPIDLYYTSIIIPLDSPIGQEIFSKSFHSSYDNLHENFQYQEHLSFCGIACISTLLNTILSNEKSNQQMIYSTIAKDFMFNGITLTNLSNVLKYYGISSQIKYSQDKKIEEEFRRDLNREDIFLIVNYWRQYHIKENDYLHQSGHFCLIGGFNSITDHVLLLDPNNKRFPHHWLSIKHLIQMISTYDQMASMSRGYLIINRQK